MVKFTGQEIVDQLKNGNTNVLKVIYDDFNKITKFITQNSGGEEDAKDFFHEALIILYEKIVNNEFELKSKLSTYLYSVCRNLWLYHLRDNKPMMFNNIRESNDEIDIYQNAFEDDDQPEINEYKMNIIMQKISELKEPCYSILMMFYFKKMSFKLIAEKLNYKTEKVVKNQKYRCIQKIKNELPKNFFSIE